MPSKRGAAGDGPSRRLGEQRLPMALAVLATGFLRAWLPAQLRVGNRWLLLAIIVVFLGVLIIGDPGRIDRDRRWLRVLTDCMLGVITVANASSGVVLAVDIVNGSAFTSNGKVLVLSGSAIWLTNVLIFALWYWELDRGGPVARARGSAVPAALVFPEMSNPDYVSKDWYPKFVDYFHFAFSTATSISPPDVSAIRPWMKLMMITEEATSLIVGVLVISRAVNIFK
jgi:hypothetical protein